MKLTPSNYHSAEANKEYMSVSQYKNFMKCEAAALAMINGEWEQPTTDALEIGKYIDCHFSGEPYAGNIVKKDGTLYAKYTQADEIIRRIEADEFLMSIIKASKKQQIRTGEIEGVPFRVMADFDYTDDMLVDLKIMKDFKDGYNGQPWWEEWRYDIQGAVYDEIFKKNRFALIGASKEKTPDITAVELPQYALKGALAEVKENAPRYYAIKNGLEEPTRCECCDYCKSTKKLKGFFKYE